MGVSNNTMIIVPASLRWLFFGRRAAAANMRDHPENYARLEELFARGVVRPLIEQTYPLERAEEAIAVLESGKVRGKVIVVI